MCIRDRGYRTILSPHGGDSGIDITAYKDELPPRIVVQVKSQDGDIKETTMCIRDRDKVRHMFQKVM